MLFDVFLKPLFFSVHILMFHTLLNELTHRNMLLFNQLLLVSVKLFDLLLALLSKLLHNFNLSLLLLVIPLDSVLLILGLFDLLQNLVDVQLQPIQLFSQLLLLLGNLSDVNVNSVPF